MLDEQDNAPLTLGPENRLRCEALERAALEVGPRVQLSSAAIATMCASQFALQRALANEVPIYGLTTGFGPFVRFGASAQGGEAQGAGLIAHLGAGYGNNAPCEIVRATMILRANALAHGFSGVDVAVVEAYLMMLEHDIIPFVPEIGSVGASGDLIPLSHIARALMGEGEVRHHGRIVSARTALRNSGIEPIMLGGRNALALVNGTSFLTAYAALAVARAERLLARAEALTGWMYRLLGCRAAGLDPRLHRARGHAGQELSATAILAEAGRYGAWEDTERPLQEIYSLRCAPQVIGACRENVSYARHLIENEMNGVNDNPLTCVGVSLGDEDTVLHGGNFFSQQVAFASDAVNAALTQTGLLLDRQIDALLAPHVNGGAPLLLAWDPGATSGMAGAQITGTALAAEMRMHTQSYATATIPTNGGNQDIVPMGTLVAREALAQTERLAPLLAIAGIALAQLDMLRACGRAPGKTTPTPEWMPCYTPYEADRPLRQDIARIAAHWLTT